MAVQVIPIKGPKDVASLEVTVVDVKSKAIVDTVMVGVYGLRPAKATSKGKAIWSGLALTSGSKEKGDFLEGWTIELFSNGKLMKFPVPPSDQVMNPTGGANHKLTVEVESPTAAVTITVTEGGKGLAGVEAEGSTKDKTGADGKVVVQALPGKGRSIHVRLKGKVLKKKGDPKGQLDDLELKLDVDAAGGAGAEVEVEALAVLGIKGVLGATRSLRNPGKSSQRPKNELVSLVGGAHDASVDKPDKNRPFVLVRGAGTVELTVEGNAERPAATWKLTRRFGSGDDLKRVDTDGGRESALTIDQEGGFVISAEVAGKTLFWLVDVATVHVDITTTRRFLGGQGVFSRNDDKPNQTVTFSDHTKTKNDGQLAVQAGRFRNNGNLQLLPAPPGQPPSSLNVAVYLAVKVRIEGPPDVEKRVLVTLLQNGTLSDATGVYEDGKGTVREKGADDKAIDSAKKLPILDANGSDTQSDGTGQVFFKSVQYPWMPDKWRGPFADPPANTFPPFIWVQSSFTVSDPFGRERWVQTLDCPEVIFKNRHKNLENGALDSPYLTSFKGGCRFRTAIASITLDAPEKILVHADMLWNVDYGGDISMPGTFADKFEAPVWKATTAACKADFVLFQFAAPTGTGIDAADAGMETFAPRFATVKDDWTPGP